MGWQVGYDTTWHRDIGYGVPAVCDDPECATTIDRGLGYVCGGEPYGGERGCGLYFCDDHLWLADHGKDDVSQLCACCTNNEPPFEAKPDVAEWVNWKLTDVSWQVWRDENPAEVTRLMALVDVVEGEL